MVIPIVFGPSGICTKPRMNRRNGRSCINAIREARKAFQQNGTMPEFQVLAELAGNLSFSIDETLPNNFISM